MTYRVNRNIGTCNMVISATLSVKAITDVLAVETGQWLSELGLVHGVNNRQLWRGELTYVAPLLSPPVASL